MSPDPAARVRAEAALRDHGLRVTDQRVIVLEAMMLESGDATAQALHERLRLRHPKLGLATVYRTLGSLVDAGVLDTLQHGHGICYRWCAPGHHHHLTCTQCHAVIELRDCIVDGWADTVGARHGYTGVQHSVELTGTCPRCAA